VERRRVALVEADRELRVLEQLRDRQAQMHAIELDKEVARAMDETALIRFRAREHGGGA
jgi:flagellar biosynthesis chaperone FliJ